MRATAGSIVQITAEVQGLEQVSPDAWAPFGTYWLAMPNASFAPLPTPPWDSTLPVYAVANGQYLVNTGGQLPRGDTIAAMDVESNAVGDLINQIQTATAVQSAGMAMAMDSSLPLPGTGSGGDGSGYTNNYILSYSFDTNLLWLQITNIVNGTAYANLYNATNQVYAIWSTPDLTIPFAVGRWKRKYFRQIAPPTFCHSLSRLSDDQIFSYGRKIGRVFIPMACPAGWTWYYFHA